MKFIANTTTLQKHLQALSGVISSSTVLPILENFLFEIEEGKLTIAATDLETSMSSVVEVEAKEGGKVAIPAKILLDILKTLPDKPLAFTINSENYAIEITSNNGKYKLAGENGEDFPRIPEAEEDVSTLTMNAAVLGNAINKTLFAVSNDELRPAMTGVYCELEENEMRFVATDAHRLVRYTRTDAKSDKATSFIMPRKALNLLRGALPGEDATVSIAYNNSNAFFSFENINLICRLIDARYPDYNAVIPKENPNTLALNKDDLQNSLKRIILFASKSTHQAVLKITGSEVQISAQDPDFSNEANERLECQYDGEDMQIAFNARFLIDMLAALDAEEIVMKLSEPTRAGLLMPAEQQPNEEVLMLIMPVMLNA